MPSLPSDEEIRWLGSTMAARMLVDISTDVRREQLIEAIRAWGPDLDLRQRQEIAARLASVFESLSGLVDARLARQVAFGKASPWPGCEGRI